jgi:Peptidase S24-like
MDRDRARLIGKELQVELSSADRSLYFHGMSMLPFLQEGDLVVVRPVAWNDLRRGDIVTYRNDDKFPTRRVLIKRSDGLCLHCDGWLHLRFQASRDDVLGRVDARCRDGRWISAAGPEWQRAARRATLRAWKKAASRRLRSFLRARR